jgi:hypothetical protein
MKAKKHVHDVTASGIQYMAELMTLGVSIATLPEMQWNRQSS